MAGSIKKRRKQFKAAPILTSTVPDRPKVEGAPHMVGYVRVSTGDQSLQRQVDALVEAGVAACDIFSDVGSGRTMERSGWIQCSMDMQPGDILVVHAADRLGRSAVGLMNLLEELDQRGVKLRILTMGLDTSTPIGRFAFNMLAIVAQLEREMIHERTMHGLQKARERGVVGGVKKKYQDKAIIEAVAKFGTNGAARRLGCSKITIIRRMKEIEERQVEEAIQAEAEEIVK